MGTYTPLSTRSEIFRNPKAAKFVVNGCTPLIILLLLCFNPSQVYSLEYRVLKSLVQHAARSLKPHLSHRQVERATYPGDQHRLIGVLAKKYRGENVKVVLVGGSITVGQGSQGIYRGQVSYVQRLRDWCAGAWPQANVQVLNGAYPGVSSEYFSTCASAHVPPDTDLVIVELCANDLAIHVSFFDRTRRAFERLVRKLLNYPHKPAVLLLNAYSPLNVPREHLKHAYLMNAEAFFFDIASFYGLPMMSMKAVAHRLSQRGVEGYLMNTTQHQLGTVGPDGHPDHPDIHKYLFWDLMHPSAQSGHRLLFELVAHMLLRASHTLLAAAAAGPVAAEMLAEDTEPMPMPVFLGNYEPQWESCFIGDKFKQMAIKMNGFGWVNEAKDRQGHPKWGYTALTPGSYIKLKTSTMFDQGQGTDAGGATAPVAGNVGMLLAYLQSYEHQGIAEISCAGCRCNSSRFDGHKPGTTSQLGTHAFTVTQHPDCVVTIAVTNSSRSKGHKIKLGALMLAEETGARVAEESVPVELDLLVGTVGAAGTFDPALAWGDADKHRGAS